MKTVIVGAGIYSEAIIAYLREWSDLIPTVVLDDDSKRHGTCLAGVPIEGPLHDLDGLASAGLEAALVCIGNNILRSSLGRRARTAGLATPNFVHPGASISETVTLGHGILVLDGAVVQPWAGIEDACIVSSNVTVAHHTSLRKGVSLAAGVTLGASIEVGAHVSVGVGANVMTGVDHVGERAIVGAGATVIRNVEPGTKVVGVPARPLTPRTSVT